MWCGYVFFFFLGVAAAALPSETFSEVTVSLSSTVSVRTVTFVPALTPSNPPSIGVSFSVVFPFFPGTWLTVTKLASLLTASA